MMLSCRGNITGQPLPKWVNIDRPASMLARNWSSVGSQCPAETRTPCSARNLVTCASASRSGARVTIG